MIDRDVGRSLAANAKDIKRLRGQSAVIEAAVEAVGAVAAGKADAVHGHLAADIVPESAAWAGNLLGATGTLQDVLDFVDAASLGGGGGGVDLAKVRVEQSLRF